MKHIASGKAISKALRAHFLTEAAIITLLMTPFFPHSKDIETYQEKTTEKKCEEIQSFDECAEMDETDVLDQEITDIGEADVLNQESGRDWVTALVLQNEATLRPLTNDEISIIMELCDKLESDFSNTDILEQSKEVNLIKQILTDLKESSSAESRTAKYWIQYLNYIQNLKDFIRAERTGNWKLHLQSVRKLLNILRLQATCIMPSQLAFTSNK